MAVVIEKEKRPWKNSQESAGHKTKNIINKT